MSEARRATVLIVEDDMLFQSLYVTRLGGEGYRVRVASDGEEALREMAKEPADLVLLDLVLPSLNGYEVLARLKANAGLAKAPVIVLSNKGEPEDIKRAMDLGAHDYLVKTTAHPREVIWKVRQALAGARGEATRLRVAIREGELDAGMMASAAGQPANLGCPKCGAHRALELSPKAERPGWFDAHFVCTQCEG